MVDFSSPNPNFPCVDSALRTTLPRTISARGPDGLRAGLVIYPRVEVNQGSIDAPLIQQWQPVAAISAVQCTPPTAPGGDAVGFDALDRVSWWLLGLVYDGIGSRPIGSPPEIDFEVRQSMMSAVATDQANGTVSPGTWNDVGLIVQVSGMLSSQWELWMKVAATEPAGTKIKVRISGLVDRMGRGNLTVQYGTLVSTHFP
jgi:hypothetical protein